MHDHTGRSPEKERPRQHEEDLKRDWARYIAQRTPQIIAKIEAKLDHESSDSDKEQESWRFNRQWCG